MREVSEQWLDMYSNDEFTTEGNVRVYGDWGHAKIDNANISYADTELSNVGQALIVKNSMPRRKRNYITLERNAWLLDGTFDYIENAVEKDIVSSIPSGLDGGFGNLNISITCNVLGTPSNAITIRFEDDFATEFTVARGNTEVVVQGQSGYNVVLLPDYNETTNVITITINKWSLPYRRVKIKELISGVRLHYDKSALSNVNFNQSVDILSGALPTNVLTLNVLDVENVYDTENGIYNNILPQIDWKVDVGHLINDEWEWVRLDKNYRLIEFTRPKNGITATFHLKGWISRITGKFPAEIQSGPDGGTDPYYWTTWEELLEKITLLTNVQILPLKSHNMQTTSAGYPTQRTFRTEIDLSEWLQTVSNASMSIIKEVENGIVLDSLVDNNVEFYEQDVVAHFDFNQAYSYPEIEVFPKLKEVSITGFKPSDDNVQYTYVTKFDLTSEVSQTAKNERVRFYDGVISSSQSFEPLQFYPKYNMWVYKFISEARRITGESRINPALELLDLVEVTTKSGLKITGYIVGLNIQFNGAFRGKYIVYAPKEHNEV